MKMSRAARPASDAREPIYASPSVTPPPIWETSSMLSDSRRQCFYFRIVDFEDLHQARELQDFTGGTAQSNQHETGADIARSFEAFHQRRHAGAINVPYLAQVQHYAGRAVIAHLAHQTLANLGQVQTIDISPNGYNL